MRNAAPGGELQEMAAALQRMAGDAMLPAWLAKALRWTAGDLLAEAERRGDLAEPPPAANDNGGCAP